MRDFGKFVVVQMLRGYKWAISPFFPPACRYVPTCSEYAMEAVERFGVFRGGCMAMWRVLRCHPFVRGGYDPVVKRSARAASDVAPEAKTPTLRQAQGRLSRAQNAREMGHPQSVPTI